jgi:PAS domain S-box-containing protein
MREFVVPKSGEVEAEDAGSASVSAMRGFGRALLAGVPGGAAVVFDQEMRVRFAEGVALARAGVGPMVGRLLPDLMRADAWQQLREPYQAALDGRTTKFDYSGSGSSFSIHVSPIVLPGETCGGLAVSHAVSEQRRLESAIVEREDAAEASEELLRSAFDRAPIGMALIGPDGRWLRVNDECCRMFGYGREELVGTTLPKLAHPDDRCDDDDSFAAAAGGERRYLHKDRSVVWVDVRSQLIRDPSGEPLYVVAHLQDISERRAALEGLRDSERTLRAVIDNTPSVICVKGRDHRYQLVNREFEEWCGIESDRILGHRSDEMPWGSIVEHQGAKDQLVLDGGDTVLEEETMLRHNRERVYLTTRFPLFDERGEIHAVCSASTDITERRDEERSKRERLQCSVEIHAALAQERFVLHGQPIVNLASMQVEQAELLVRMLRVRGGTELVSPAELLPTAERFGLIGLIDEWVVDRAVEHAAAGHRIEVNLSAKTISDADQVNRIEQVVLNSGAPPQNLIFEITETAVADHLDAAREFALRLRRLGCAFALDDFGVGHGTFRYLRHLPVDYLKIDLQFVRDLLSDPADRDVVQAIIGVARQFEIKTIAEGVEDQATLEELRRMGVDYAQGYEIGRPVPLAELWTPTTVKER